MKRMNFPSRREQRQKEARMRQEEHDALSDDEKFEKAALRVASLMGNCHREFVKLNERGNLTRAGRQMVQRA